MNFWTDTRCIKN